MKQRHPRHLLESRFHSGSIGETTPETPDLGMFGFLVPIFSGKFQRKASSSDLHGGVET